MFLKLSRIFTACFVLAPIVACSAGPIDGETEATAHVEGAVRSCAFNLTTQNVKAWNGGAVAGIVVRVEKDPFGNANWAVVDLASSTITEVLAVTSSQQEAFQSTVIDVSLGGGCDGTADVSGGVPCNPSGGGTCGVVYLPQISAGPSACLWSDIVTTVAPACVKLVQTCVPATCQGACGTMADGCTREVQCGGCGFGKECLQNRCVNTKCAAGYRFCGEDGCVKGSVCR